MKIFSFLSVIFLWGLIILYAQIISELQNQIKLVNPCKIITVMTPNGSATSLCAP